MLSIKHFSVFILAAALLIAGCKKDPDPQPSVTEDYSAYFPVKLGQYRIYDVDSIHYYDVTLTSDTFHYQIKEEVSEWISQETTGASTKSWYEMKIYRRTHDTLDWEHVGFAMQSVSATTAERKKDNLHFVKMNFPIALDKTWKGNAFISDSVSSPFSSDWDYTYTTIDTAFTHQGDVFSPVVVVTQFDSQNAITKDIEQEAYASGIGLVYKNATHVERQTVDLMTWIPEKGFIVTQRLREYNF